MNLNDLLTHLAVFAATTVGSFIVAVGVDVVAGVAVAVKSHSFDPHKVMSFLRSQLGTREAIALAGLVATATITAFGSALLKGGLTQESLQAIADAALAAATAGAGAMLLSVLADIYEKAGVLFSNSVPAPAPAKP